MHYAWKKEKKKKKKEKKQCKTSFYLKRVREVPVKPKVKVSEGNRFLPLLQLLGARAATITTGSLNLTIDALA